VGDRAGAHLIATRRRPVVSSRVLGTHAGLHPKSETDKLRDSSRLVPISAFSAIGISLPPTERIEQEASDNFAVPGSDKDHLPSITDRVDSLK
jgi:hypothetical protein